MSLSRPVTFPLLKLPFLCIECVIKSWDIYDIIFLALFSKRTRQIVKYSKIALSRIEITLSDQIYIKLDSLFKKWYFSDDSERESFFDKHRNSRKYPLVLQKNAIRLYTVITDVSLESYSTKNKFIAFKLAMKFLNEMFKCSVEAIRFDGDNFPESGDIGVKSTVNLSINHLTLRSLGYAQSQKLSLLLKNLEVTGICTIMKNTENDFYVDPKLFKCKTLIFYSDSAAWVTMDILLQFEVPQLRVYYCPFSVEDILSFVTDWLHSDNQKFEYLFIIIQDTPISLENFQTEELNPVPFSERTRVPLTECSTDIDFSQGLEIVRQDGFVATIHVKRRYFFFFVWNNQSAITQH